MHRLLVILLLSLLVPGSCGFNKKHDRVTGVIPGATSQTGTVSGYIYTPMGSGRAAQAAPPGYMPLAAARVSVSNTAATAVTDFTGFFSIPGVPAGVQTVTATKDGYNPITLGVTVSPNQTTIAGGNEGSIALPERAGSIDVSWTPATLTVDALHIDGIETGFATATMLSGIAVGDHTIAISRAGYEVSPASHTVTVRHGEVTAAAFTLTEIIYPPEITGFSPALGAAGDTVSIYGSGFGAAQGQGWVRFGGAVAECSFWSEDRITCAVPHGAATGRIIVSAIGGEAESAASFKVVSHIQAVVIGEQTVVDNNSPVPVRTRTGQVVFNTDMDTSAAPRSIRVALINNTASVTLYQNEYAQSIGELEWLNPTAIGFTFVEQEAARLSPSSVYTLTLSLDPREITDIHGNELDLGRSTLPEGVDVVGNSLSVTFATAQVERPVIAAVRINGAVVESNQTPVPADVSQVQVDFSIRMQTDSTPRAVTVSLINDTASATIELDRPVIQLGAVTWIGGNTLRFALTDQDRSFTPGHSYTASITLDPDELLSSEGERLDLAGSLLPQGVGINGNTISVSFTAE